MEEKQKLYTDKGITDTLRENYMPYAMSVIVSRAIPEIDGFKPSHRKLLYLSLIHICFFRRLACYGSSIDVRDGLRRYKEQLPKLFVVRHGDVYKRQLFLFAFA